MTRRFLEALLIARAVVRPESAPALLRALDRDRVSPACWALLSQVATPDGDLVRAATDGQRQLAAAVDAITIDELTLYTAPELVALCNALPERSRREPAWQRHLAIAAGTAA